MASPDCDTTANPGSDVGIVMAHGGTQRFRRTRWTEHRVQHWVLDVITRGTQVQRVGDGAAFERGRGVLALYAPSTPYYEQQVAGEALSEAYVVFTARGATAATLRGLTGAAGYCHIDDPHELVIGPLQRLGARFLVHGAAMDILGYGFMLECIGMLPTSTEVAPAQRRLALEGNPEEALQVRVARFLDENVHRPISVAALAAALNVSPSWLAHAYPKASGQTPYQAILHSRIRAAKRLLLSTRLNVQETADHLGFSSPFNFSRAFRKVEGCAPRDYVSRHLSGPGRRASPGA